MGKKQHKIETPKKKLIDDINKYNSRLRDLDNKKMDKTINIGIIHTYKVILQILRKRLELIS